MQPFPHHYTVAAAAAGPSDVELNAQHLPVLRSASPAEFDGPGDRWSPESLLVGALGDCFILTFRAIARASKIQWTSIRCDVTGTLDRVDRVTRFTNFAIHAHLTVPAGTEFEPARRALEKAERNCLISSSLNGTVNLIARLRWSSLPIWLTSGSRRSRSGGTEERGQRVNGDCLRRRVVAAAGVAAATIRCADVSRPSTAPEEWERRAGPGSTEP